jgi:hypothetical protein
MFPLVEHPTGRLLAAVVGLCMQCICHCGSVGRRQAPPRAGAMTFMSFASGTSALCHHLCAYHPANPCYSSTPRLPVGHTCPQNQAMLAAVG